MTRIDMTTRELHELLKPVLPHTLDDNDWPQLGQIRIEVRERSVVAVATDKFTLAAERHTLTAQNAVLVPPRPVAIRLSDAKAALALFKFSKDDDPRLRITIDTARVPLAGTMPTEPDALMCWALTVEDDEGRRIVLRDVLDPNRDPLAKWRRNLRDVLRRRLLAAPASLSLQAGHLARWQAAVRKGDRLALYSGDRDSKPLLVLVEDHFAGLWQPLAYLDGPEQMLVESPWRYELAEIHETTVGFDPPHVTDAELDRERELGDPDDSGDPALD